MLCPKCCNYIPDDSLTCPDCGNPIPEDTRQRAIGSGASFPEGYTEPTQSFNPSSAPAAPVKKVNISAKGCMTFAVIIFLFFSKLCGIIAWSYARHVIQSNNEGNIRDALECREKSIMWSWAGLGIGIVYTLILLASQ